MRQMATLSVVQLHSVQFSVFESFVTPVLEIFEPVVVAAKLVAAEVFVAYRNSHVDLYE